MAERLGLEKLSLILQVFGPRPEQIDGQPAERAERRRDDGHMRGHPFSALGGDDEVQVVPLSLDDPRDSSSPGQADEHDDRGAGDGDPVGHEELLTRSRFSSSTQPMPNSSNG